MNVVQRLRRFLATRGPGPRVPRGHPSRHDYIGLLFLLIGIAGTAMLWSRLEDSIIDLSLIHI